MTSLPSMLREKIGFNPIGWLRARSMMVRRVEEFLPSLDGDGDGPDALVVITPWQGTSIPWFTLAVALMMAKSGARIRFVIDDVPFGENLFRHRFIIRAIRSVMAIVAQRFEVVSLSERQPVGVDDAARAEIERLARLNATWALRGEMPQQGREALVQREISQTCAAQQYIAALFETVVLPDLLLTPGGVFGHSGMWFYEARKRGIRIASFDSGGYETTMIAADGMACQLQDVPRAFRALTDEWVRNADSRQQALDRAALEIAKRRQGTDAFASQVMGAGSGGGELAGGILIALNSSWDAAALGLHRAYASNTEWIVETVRYLLQETDRTVIVRQHPAERLAIAATSEDYALMLQDAFGENDRLVFIAAEDPINSYALLEQVAAVVTHTSTIGIEAVAFGKPVVTGSASYYAHLGFVEQSETREGYESLLGDAASGKLGVTQAMSDDARLCFYLTQCCNWVFSAFNPADFARWIDEPIAHWQGQASVVRMIEALNTGQPVALLNHHATTGRTA